MHFTGRIKIGQQSVADHDKRNKKQEDDNHFADGDDRDVDGLDKK